MAIEIIDILEFGTAVSAQTLPVDAEPERLLVAYGEEGVAAPTFRRQPKWWERLLRITPPVESFTMYASSDSQIMWWYRTDNAGQINADGTVTVVELRVRSSVKDMSSAHP